jgi:hypothetical protein
MKIIVDKTTNLVRGVFSDDEYVAPGVNGYAVEGGVWATLKPFESELVLLEGDPSTVETDRTIYIDGKFYANSADGQARAKRDKLLRETVDAINPMRWESMSPEQQDAWRAYRQALLDVPQQAGFPWNVTWPPQP